MTRKGASWAAWIVLVGGAGAGCATTSPQRGDETHFQTCATDADCRDAGAGHRCASGVCSASDGEGPDGAAPSPRCAPFPTQLVDFKALAAQLDAGGISATQLAVDAANVYFLFDNTLMRVPIRGGSVATILRLSTLPNLTVQNVDLVVNSTSVVMHYPTSDGANDQVVSVSIPEGSPTTLATSSGRIFGFGADEHAVYFIDEGGTKSVPRLGGDVRLLTDRVASGSSGGALAVVGSDVIVTASNLGTVLAIPVQGGLPTTLATQQPNAAFPMSCGSDICWWTGATPAGVAGTPGPGAIVRLDGTGKLASLPRAPYFPWSLVFDGTDFFETVGCDVCDGTLLRIPAAGGPSVTVATGSFVAVDDSCAYWSVSDGISSARKSYVAPAAP